MNGLLYMRKPWGQGYCRLKIKKRVMKPSPILNISLSSAIKHTQTQYEYSKHMMSTQHNIFYIKQRWD